MAVKKQDTKHDLQPAKDSLRQDINEIKLLLGCMLKDLQTLSDNIETIAKLEKIRMGVE